MVTCSLLRTRHVKKGSNSVQPIYNNIQCNAAHNRPIIALLSCYPYELTFTYHKAELFELTGYFAAKRKTGFQFKYLQGYEAIAKALQANMSCMGVYHHLR